MRDIIFLLKRTSLSSPHRLKFLSQAHFSLSHISPHPNNKNTHTFHIFPISSSKHPYSTTYSTLFLSLLFPISTFLSPYRIQIPNATKHIPISPTTIISTLPLPLFSLLSPLFSNINSLFPLSRPRPLFATLPFPLSFISKYFLLYNSSLSLAPQVTTPLTVPLILSSSSKHKKGRHFDRPFYSFVLSKKIIQ